MRAAGHAGLCPVLPVPEMLGPVPDRVRREHVGQLRVRSRLRHSVRRRVASVPFGPGGFGGLVGRLRGHEPDHDDLDHCSGVRGPNLSAAGADLLQRQGRRRRDRSPGPSRRSDLLQGLQLPNARPRPRTVSAATPGRGRHQQTDQGPFFKRRRSHDLPSKPCFRRRAGPLGARTLTCERRPAEPRIRSLSRFREEADR